MDFCKTCQGLLEVITTSKLQFKCPRCSKIYESTPESTELVSEELRTEDISEKFHMMIRNGFDDAVNHRVRKPCPHCKTVVVSLLRIGDEQKVIYVCPNKHVF